MNDNIANLEQEAHCITGRLPARGRRHKLKTAQHGTQVWEKEPASRVVIESSSREATTDIGGCA